jgi:hypothetical protein
MKIKRICDYTQTHTERKLKEGTVGMNGAKAPGRQKKKWRSNIPEGKEQVNEPQCASS